MKKRKSKYAGLTADEIKRVKAEKRKAYEQANKDRRNALRNARNAKKRAAEAPQREAARAARQAERRLRVEERLAAQTERQKEWLAARTDPPVVPKERVYKTTERQRELMRLWRVQNKERQKFLELLWRQRNPRYKESRYPEAIAAKLAVKDAVKSGYLVKTPCIVCGSAEWVEGHHPDYSKPLEVMWLCQPCHRDEHERMKSLGLDPYETIIGGPDADGDCAAS